MKNQLLLISTLVFAGTTSAMADINNRMDGYEYSSEGGGFNASYSNCRVIGSNGRTGVQNWNWGSYDINLGQDARYELIFEFQSENKGESAQPLLNLYLASNSGSIIFGNYYGINEGGASPIAGAANAFLYGGMSVAHGDTHDVQSSYVLNGYTRDETTGWQQSARITSLTAGGNLKNGRHTYKIVIESFGDSAKQDLIKFTYTGPNDSDGTWSDDLKITERFSGITHDAILDVGYFFEEDGGSLLLSPSFKKLVRTEQQPTTPPTTDTDQPSTDPSTPTPPDVPEPSAFGLLAGLGAIALAASRRRRK